MIKAYYRAASLDEALRLLARPGVHTGIVTGYDARLAEEVEEVVDLQALALGGISVDGPAVMLGALTRLQALVDCADLPDWLRETARREDVSTLRRMRTLADLLLKPDSESALLAALLVCDASVTVQTLTETRSVALADYLRARGDGLPTALHLTVSGAFAEARVARTPGDRPIVAAAARRADDGGVRLALCGVAPTPIPVDPGALDALTPVGDFRGSSAYRKEMAAVLSQRVLSQVGDRVRYHAGSSGGWSPDRNDRGPIERAEPASDPGCVHPHGCDSIRLLHSGDGAGRQGVDRTQPEPDRGRSPRCALRHP